MAGSHTAGNGLRTQQIGIRIGLTALVLVLLGGLAASASHLANHYANRDERPELSLDDIKGAFHGINTPSLLKLALERGHPEQLPAAEKQILLEWLSGTRIVEDYDSLDLGESAPAEVIDRDCLECHSRRSGAEVGGGVVPLDYYDDVERLAFSKRVMPTPVAVLAASTHAHALSLATLGLITVLLALMTRWSVSAIGWACALLGLGLLGDIGGWWLARLSADWVWLIVVSGVIFNGTTGLLLSAVLAELWVPYRDSQVGKDS